VQTPRIPQEIDDALRSEWDNSTGMLAAQGLAGATRFSGGKGRHGDFGDI
jgi:enoyl-CoA hydratase